MSFAALGVAGTVALAASATQAGIGGIRSITANKQRKARERELSAMANQSPLATASKSLNDYYNQALNRANQNIYQSAQYKQAQQEAQRGMASGLSALQDRRSAIGGISRLAGAQSNALQNAAIQAEAQKNLRFGQLGQAAQAKSAEEKYLFDINKMTPYNRRFGLKQMETQAANERYANAVNMVGQGLGNAASIGMQAGLSGGGTKGTAGTNPLGLDQASGLSPTRQKLNMFTGWNQ